MDLKRPSIIILGIITAGLLILTIVSFVLGSDQPHMAANVITQEYMEEYTRWKMWNDIGSITIVWTIAGAVSLVIEIIWEGLAHRDEFLAFFTHCAAYILMIVLGLWLQPVSILDVHAMVHDTPRAQAVYLSRSYYKNDIMEYLPHRGSRGEPMRHYYFVYSNRAQEEVTRSEYNNHFAGEEYYLIMCGNTVVGRFDKKLFTIEQS